MVSKIIHNCQIKDGKLLIHNREQLARSVANMEDMDAELIIKERPKFRSNKQISYYWGVVIRYCQAGFKDLGHDFTTEETHDQLSGRFLFVEIPDDITGEPIKKHLSLSKDAEEVDTRMMTEYIERCRKFAAEWLSVDIPSPGQPPSDE